MKELLIALLLLSALPAYGQRITDVRRESDRFYAMRIDGVEYLAMRRADAEKLQTDFVAAENDMKELRQLRSAYQKLASDYAALTERYKGLSDDSIKLNERYADAANRLVRLTGDYDKLVAQYDGLAGKYRDVAVRSAPRQPTDIGAGIVHAGGENRLVGMAGVGTNIFSLGVRGWVFGGQSTYGVLMGVSF